jgi:hypothetical protein
MINEHSWSSSNHIVKSKNFLLNNLGLRKHLYSVSESIKKVEPDDVLPNEVEQNPLSIYRVLLY